MDLFFVSVAGVFVLGLIIGSFLNVVICRVGTGCGFGGRSACPSCDTQLRWFELFPILSFVALKGRCRSCFASISLQYPIVELGTGFAFVLAYYVAGPTLWFFVHAIMLASLIVIFAYDFHHKIIPTGALIVFLISALLIGSNDLGIYKSFVAGLALFAPFYILWRVSSGKWIGLGDADLSAGIGFAVGVVTGISAIVMAFWLGLAYALVIYGFKTLKFGEKKEIPLGPFLVVGFIIAYITQVDVMGLSHFIR